MASRLPFDPDRVSTPQPSSPRRDQPLSVSQLSGLIKQVLTENLPPKIRVVGEISNLSDRNHWFFSLKDAQASLRCVCFASVARRIKTPVEDGMQVVVTGRIDYYDAAGNVQLYVDKIEPVGQGALELRLRQMIEQLRKLGYFDESRKKELPLVPRRVAVVTSRSAAALQDVINTAQRRWPGCQLLLYDVRVQGDAAAGEIAAAIGNLSAQGQRLGIDAIILTRGGGSIEDLWAFNERIVADALFQCSLPVVAAIGHETDVTVAELVADLRCATPTQAAMKLIPERAALEQELRHWADRLRQGIQRQHRHAQQRLAYCSERGFFRRPEDLVLRAQRRLDEVSLQLARALPHRLQPERSRIEHLSVRLDGSLPRRMRQESDTLTRLTARLHTLGPRILQRNRQQLEAIARHLAAVSPKNVLKRGYTYTLGPDGHVLRHAAQAQAGQRITTVLADGQVHSRVEGQNDPPPTGPSQMPSSSPATPATRPAAPKRRSRKADNDDAQGALF